MSPTCTLVGFVEDFQRAKLGNSLRTSRLVRIARDLQPSPQLSIPMALDDAGVEGAYRFIRNPNVDPLAMAKAHWEGTADRAARCEIVLVVSDSTSYTVGASICPGLGVVDPSREAGYYSHTCFAIRDDGCPLGVLYNQEWTRTGITFGIRSHSESSVDSSNEYRRWLFGIKESEQAIENARIRLGVTSPIEIIHVGDRETDCLELIWQMQANGFSFVFRAATDRRLEPGRKKTDKKLFGAVQGEKVICKRKITVVQRHKMLVPVEANSCEEWAFPWCSFAQCTNLPANTGSACASPIEHDGNESKEDAFQSFQHPIVSFGLSCAAGTTCAVCFRNAIQKEGQEIPCTTTAPLTHSVVVRKRRKKTSFNLQGLFRKPNKKRKGKLRNTVSHSEAAGARQQSTKGCECANSTEMLAQATDQASAQSTCSSSSQKLSTASEHPSNGVVETAVDSSGKLAKKGEPRQRMSHKMWTEKREAVLEIRATRVTIFGAKGQPEYLRTKGLTVNAVYVSEINPPAGVNPICWYLITDRPVKRKKQVQDIVNIYCRRWLIEELHKAIKTGCEFEKHRFRHGSNFLRMQVIYMAIAGDLLRLRWYERERPDAPATDILNHDQIEVLRLDSMVRKSSFPANPTARDALRAIARLGGHLAHNGSPGWLVLRNGMAVLAVRTLQHQLTREYLYSSGQLGTNDSASTAQFVAAPD